MQKYFVNCKFLYKFEIQLLSVKIFLLCESIVGVVGNRITLKMPAPDVWFSHVTQLLNRVVASKGFGQALGHIKGVNEVQSPFPFSLHACFSSTNNQLSLLPKALPTLFFFWACGFYAHNIYLDISLWNISGFICFTSKLSLNP